MCAFGNCADIHRPGRRRAALSGGELRFGARGNYPLAQSVLSRHAKAQDLKLSALLGGALAAAVLAAVTVWLFTLLPGLWVWGAFIGWASYDHSGANRRALLTSSVCMVFGVVMAWLVAITVASGVLALQSAFASAAAAGVASFFIVYVSFSFSVSAASGR